MVSIYFVRHAQPDFSWNDTSTRPLTAEGLEDSKRVTEMLADKNIMAVYSSPFKRTMQTVSGLADKLGLGIITDERLRERIIGKRTESDFLDYARHQWQDFGYKAIGGESLAEVQERNITALSPVISRHENESIAVATHGTSLSAIINYYDSRFGFDDFLGIINTMPYILKVIFENGRLTSMQDILRIEKVYNG